MRSSRLQTVTLCVSQRSPNNCAWTISSSYPARWQPPHQLCCVQRLADPHARRLFPSTAKTPCCTCAPIILSLALRPRPSSAQSSHSLAGAAIDRTAPSTAHVSACSGFRSACPAAHASASQSHHSQRGWRLHPPSVSCGCPALNPSRRHLPPPTLLHRTRCASAATRCTQPPPRPPRRHLGVCCRSRCRHRLKTADARRSTSGRRATCSWRQACASSRPFPALFPPSSRHFLRRTRTAHSPNSPQSAGGHARNGGVGVVRVGRGTRGGAAAAAVARCGTLPQAKVLACAAALGPSFTVGF